jgi:hypothetical protein
LKALGNDAVDPFFRIAPHDFFPNAWWQKLGVNDNDRLQFYLFHRFNELDYFPAYTEAFRRYLYGIHAVCQDF